MNKGRRFELKMLKFKKRLRNYRIQLSKTESIDRQGNFYSFRSHGKPCSCWCCQPEKMKRNGDKKKEFKEIRFQTEN